MSITHHHEYIFQQASWCKLVLLCWSEEVSSQKRRAYKLGRKLGVLHENRFVPLVSQARLELCWHEFALCLVYIMIKTTKFDMISDHESRRIILLNMEDTTFSIHSKGCS